MSHYVIKITSGELVYGVVDEKATDKKILILQNPLVWEDYESEDGRTGSALVNYITGAKENKIPISTSSIISMSLMTDTFANFYDVAVAVQKITDAAYKEKLEHMTRKMRTMVIDYQDKAYADETGSLIVSSTDTDTTIH